jgi:hypothetical protein
MYIFLKTTHRDEFNGIIHAAPILKKVTPVWNLILDSRAPGQVSHEFGPTLRDESNGIGFTALSSQ